MTQEKGCGKFIWAKEEERKLDKMDILIGEICHFSLQLKKANSILEAIQQNTKRNHRHELRIVIVAVILLYHLFKMFGY